jgi:hypothetical protein
MMTATDDASALADTDGGRTRRTRTDLDGVDSWQVPDTGVVPQSPPARRNPFPSIADYAFLPD